MTLTLLAFISHIALQIIQLYLQLLVDPLSLGALSAVDDQDEDNHKQQEATSSCNACDCFSGKGEGLWDVIFNTTNNEF